MLFKKWVLACAAGLSGGTLGFAERAVAAEQSDSEVIEEVVVIAHPLSAEGLSQAGQVLEGEALERKRAASIGATLAQETGVHSAQFGIASGRPVIHGLGGPRVRIMEDRIDALDVSVTSTDHAVMVEPFIAERVEILKGPSTVLYGSGAIGGVVDVHTGRIPHKVPDRAFSGGVESRYDNNTHGTSTAFKANGGGGRFAWHLDGAWKDGDDYEIPGYAESARLRAEEGEHEGHDEAHEDDHEADEEAEAYGELPGSAYDSDSMAGGASYVADWGFLGVAVSRSDSTYGLPGGHGHEHGHDEEEHAEEEHGEEDEEMAGNPILDLEQTRTDLELGIASGIGPFDSLNVRLGINDYEHQEVEPSGEVATRFSNEAWELRTELTYSLDKWRGALGVQFMDREFSAVGEEAFVPPVDSFDAGIFCLGERTFDNFALEAGLRLGKTEHDPEIGSTEDFTTFSGSLGFVLTPTDRIELGLIADLSSRAPVSEELYSNGPHLATNSFEIGNPDLDSERAANLAATFRYDSERLRVGATIYYTRFSDFIYEFDTGEEEDELPVFQYLQEDARFFGIDLEFEAILMAWEGGDFRLNGMLDLVEAEVDVRGNDHLPRIPPQRYGLGTELRMGRVLASANYLRSAKQDDVSASELITDEYEDLSAYLGVDIPVREGSLRLFLQGKNLTDDEQRYHASFIKDFAPAPGRRVEVGARLTF